MNILVALIIFSVIVVIHELGHFLLAKKNGVGVTEFSVGMGPRILTVVKTEKGFSIRFFVSGKEFEEREDWKDRTKYSIKLLPLGGSCAMIGEDELSEAENAFNKKGVWARISVIFAGPFFNFLLAFVFSVILVGQSGVDIPVVTDVPEGRPGYEAGIEEGDMVKSLDGKRIVIARDINSFMQFNTIGDEVQVVVERDGEEKELTVNPHYTAYMFGFSYSMQDREAEISGVSEGMPFEKAGIKAGDVITAVNDEEIASGNDLNAYMDKQVLDGTSYTFTYRRDGEEKTVSIAPVSYENTSLGISYGAIEEKNALGVIRYSFVEVRYWIETTIKSVGQLITGKIGRDEIAGPVGIVDMVGGVIEESKEEGLSTVILNIIYMTILLSANLGVMNLLPIPALDGGRLVFLFIEAIRGKPIDPEKEGMVHLVGFAALMLLMVFVLYNDIARLMG